MRPFIHRWFVQPDNQPEQELQAQTLEQALQLAKQHGFKEVKDCVFEWCATKTYKAE